MYAYVSGTFSSTLLMGFMDIQILNNKNFYSMVLKRLFLELIWTIEVSIFYLLTHFNKNRFFSHTMHPKPVPPSTLSSSAHLTSPPESPPPHFLFRNEHAPPETAAKQDKIYTIRQGERPHIDTEQGNPIGKKRVLRASKNVRYIPTVRSLTKTPS